MKKGEGVVGVRIEDGGRKKECKERRSRGRRFEVGKN
jgi:hypothetical protein